MLENMQNELLSLIRYGRKKPDSPWRKRVPLEVTNITRRALRKAIVKLLNLDSRQDFFLVKVLDVAQQEEQTRKEHK